MLYRLYYILNIPNNSLRKIRNKITNSNFTAKKS